jgi:pimeloyl-ACP methyl ester carboxylesterase
MSEARGDAGGGGRDYVIPGWLARVMCHVALTLPRYSPVKVLEIGHVARFGRMAGVSVLETRGGDGVRLKAAFVPGVKQDDGVKRLPVVFAHGIYQMKESNSWLVGHLVSHGFDVLAVDLRSHGASRGRGTTFGVKEREDISRLADEAQKRGLVGERYISMGLSLGAGSSLQHAAVDGRVAGVCAIAPFLDVTTAVNSYRDKYFGYVTRRRVLESFEHAAGQMGFRMAEASSVEAVKKLKVPVLYLVGERDTNLGYALHTKPLYDATPAGLGAIEIIPGATHFNIHKGRFEAFNRAVLAFCGRLSGG